MRRKRHPAALPDVSRLVKVRHGKLCLDHLDLPRKLDRRPAKETCHGPQMKESELHVWTLMFLWMDV